MTHSSITVRRARTADVPWILEVTKPLVDSRVLLGKDAVSIYEAVQEFRIAEDESGNPIGCGALHVMWQDLGEIRTLAVTPEWLGKGVGAAILARLVEDATELGLGRLFCLTFEVDFFTKHRQFDGAKAARDLGFRPAQTMEQEVADITRWYREHGWV